MKTSIKSKLDSLHLSDIYSLILFVMYKIQDIPEYAMLSELCYLLDGANLTRLLTYFAGKTITIPTEDEFANMSKALLLYQYVNIEGKSLTEAYSNLKDTTPKQKEQITDIYLKLIPIMNKYNIDRGQIKHGYK
jgi:hypothetical protein